MIRPGKKPGARGPTLRRELLLLFFLALSVFLLTSAGFDTSEGRFHYMIAHQIVTQGSLSFSEPQEGTFTVAPNGRTYASHEIGNTVFLLPVACLNAFLEKELEPRLGSRKTEYVTGFFVALMPTLYCALTIVLLYALLRVYFQKSLSIALSASLAFAFCTFVWTYSRNLFDGVLCMALLTGAMVSMMEFQRTLRTRFFVLATALLGFGIITRLSMVVPLAAFGVYVCITFWRDRTKPIHLLLVGAIVLAPFAIWQTYYNALRTGNWLTSPVQTAQYAANNGLSGNVAVGVTGLLFSPGKSIFLYLPIAVLSVLCFRRFMAMYRAEAVFVAVLSGFWLLLHAKLASWFGAWGWGPRHFITIAPVLVLPACVMWEWFSETFARRAFRACVLAWGALLAASSIIGNWHFRMGLAVAQNREPDMIWSFRRGQAVDMIAGAVSNLRNVFLHQPGPTIPNLSPANQYASNTINVWLNSAVYFGISPLLLSSAALVLILVAVYCGFSFRQLMVSAGSAEAPPKITSPSPPMLRSAAS